MKTKTLTISVLLLAVVLAPLAMAADEPASRGPRGGQGESRQGRGRARGGDRLIQQLDLTEEQQQKVETIREENGTQIQAAQQAVRDANIALQEAIEGGTDDEIIAAATALGKAYGKQGVLRAQTARKIEAILTPEQQAKLKELKAQMKERMQQRREEGGQFGQGGGQGRRQGRGGEGGGRRRPQE